MKTILEFLDGNALQYGEKRAFFDDEGSLTWAEVRKLSFRVASAVLKLRLNKDFPPVSMKLRKNPLSVVAFLGVHLAGLPYVFLDPDLPPERLKIVEDLLGKGLCIDEKILEDFLCSEINEEEVREKNKVFSPDDSLYVSFTSSTTGEPKGVLTAYRSVYCYVTELIRALGFDAASVMANQAPFHFDAYLKDVYTAIFTGGSVFLVNRQDFLHPQSLLDKLMEKEVNTLTWSASAYRVLSAFPLLIDEAFANNIRLITFGSEVMRADTLCFLREKFKNSRIFQLYGTTETTGMTAYYEVKRDFSETEKIPLGTSFPGMKLFLYEGEILISGVGLSKGYYKNEALTKKGFREVNGERAYFTGDLGTMSADGILFLGRKNRVIKRAGYMLSLDELEAFLRKEADISEAAAIFDEEKDKIRLFFTGEAESGEVRTRLSALFPKAALPATIKKLSRIPRLSNGKIDYRGLKHGEIIGNFEGYQ